MDIQVFGSVQYKNWGVQTFGSVMVVIAKVNLYSCLNMAPLKLLKEEEEGKKKKKKKKHF